MPLAASAMVASVCAVAAALLYCFYRHGGAAMAQYVALALAGWLAWISHECANHGPPADA